MSLRFKFIPLTFIKDENEIKKLIRNTIILKHFFEKNQRTVKLESLIEDTQYGYNASALLSGKNKFLRISDITDGNVNWDTVPFCDCNDEETYLLHQDDILIARTGGTTGKSFFITNPPEHSIYAGYLIRIRANEKNNPQFINLFLNSYVYWSQITSINEGEFRPSANANTLKNLILPQCSPQEQEDAINLSNLISVSGYETLNQGINKALAEYEKIKEFEKETTIQAQQTALLKQSILQEAIQGKLTTEWREQNSDVEPASELLKHIKAEKDQLIKEKKIKKEKPVPPIKEDEIPFDLPEGWLGCKLRDISLRIHYGYNTSAKFENKEIKLLRITDIQNNNVNWENVPSCEIAISEIDNYLLKENDIVIARTGGTIGKSYLIKDIYLKTVFASYLIRVIPSRFIISQFLKIFLESPYYWKQLSNAAWGAGQPNVNGTALSNLIIFIPPFEEQQAIVEKVEKLLEKCDQLDEEIENLNNHSKDLLKALFNEVFELK